MGDDDIHENALNSLFHWLNHQKPQFSWIYARTSRWKHAQCLFDAMHQPLLIHSLTYGAHKYIENELNKKS